jgi:hypothetical protein
MAMRRIVWMMMPTSTIAAAMIRDTVTCLCRSWSHARSGLAWRLLAVHPRPTRLTVRTADAADAHKAARVLLTLSVCCIGAGGLLSGLSLDKHRNNRLPPVGFVGWALNRLKPAAQQRVLLVMSVVILALGLVGLFMAL